MRAWYFSDSTKRLRYGDDRAIQIGKVHSVDPPIECCRNGLHGSISILDALNYAPGTIVYQVDLFGTVDEQHDKVAASGRRYVRGGVDIRDILVKFACDCALDVITLWDAPEKVLQFLKDPITYAAYAADAAANTAAYAAANTAAYAAAYAAAKAVNKQRAIYASRLEAIVLKELNK